MAAREREQEIVTPVSGLVEQSGVTTTDASSAVFTSSPGITTTESERHAPPIICDADEDRDRDSGEHDLTIVENTIGRGLSRKHRLAKARLELAKAQLELLEAEASGSEPVGADELSYSADRGKSAASSGTGARPKSPRLIVDATGTRASLGVTDEPRVSPMALEMTPEEKRRKDDAQRAVTGSSYGASETHVPDRWRATASSHVADRCEPQRPFGAEQTLKELASALLEVARGDRPANKRYHCDLPIFSGLSSEWLHFKAAYVESAPSYLETENRARLRKCLKGVAMEAVRCLFLGSTADQIMVKLEQRFGRPDALILQELDRLRGIPRSTDTPRDVCVFACKVNNIIMTIKSLNKPHYLYNPETVNVIVDKFTPIMRTRWYDYERGAHEEEPALSVLGMFLEREADLNARHAKAEEIDNKGNRNIEGRQRAYTTSEPQCPTCQGKCNHVAACHRFKNMTVDERWENARKNKLCFRCLRIRNWKHRCKNKPCEASGCKYFHHRLLHSDRGGVSQPTAAQGVAAVRDPVAPDRNGGRPPLPASDAPRTDRRLPAAAVTSTREAHAHKRTLLKIIPIIITGSHGEIDAYALLDDGSTVTLITEDIAQQVGAQGPHDPFYIEAVGGARIDAARSQRVTLNIRGKYSDKRLKIEARTIDRLDISAQWVSQSDLEGCEHLQAIAGQLAYDEGKPSLLIGQDNWDVLLASEVRRGRINQPVASLTPLGWVLHGQSGCYGQAKRAFASLHRCSHIHTDRDLSLDQLMREYFSLDSLGIEPRRPRNDPETKAIRILEETTRPLPKGGYETGLLWENKGEPFPDNYQATLGRLQGVESRLRKDPQLKAKYAEQMYRMLEQGYAEVAPPPPSNGILWYLPHFPVLNPSKPGKVRLVHDAAARTHGVCLNDRLITGPPLLQSLLGVLLRFRQRPVGIAADIKDMFLRIKIREEDRDALRFLWREDSPTGMHTSAVSMTPTEYRMTSLPFGATSSPTTAIFVKNLNATVHKTEYPEAFNPILYNHYMDDYLQSFDTAEEAASVARAVDAVHRRGNFELQRWTSNCHEAIADFITETTCSDMPLNKEEKVLGLVWYTTDDTLGFNLSKIFPYYNPTPTKRELLRVTMSLYDPVGVAAMITTQAKRLLRKAWSLGLGWDEPLPTGLESEWHDWLTLLKNLESVRIPRCYPGYSQAIKLELHIFVDASETAYASVVYWRSESTGGEIKVSLAAAKGRVAPLKITSIPRLELQAAVMGSRLAQSVVAEHDRRPDRRVFWSDSRTVLAWLRAGAKSFKPFVAHRIAELEESTTAAEWRWCPSALNVSDDCTRDAPPDFAATHRWFHGPHFLYEGEEAWPTEKEPLPTHPTDEERVTTTTITARPCLMHALPDVTRFSSWLRLIRATARVLQFIDLCRARTAGAATKRTRRVNDDDPAWKPAGHAAPRSLRDSCKKVRKITAPRLYLSLPAEYALRAERLWVRAAQEESFPNELSDISNGKAPSTSSRLRNLALIIEHGTLRLRSRIAAAANITNEMIAPAIMDGDHLYCRLYIEWLHRQLHHSGVECVANEVRQRYWVVRLRPTVRSVIKRCQPCRLRRAVPAEPQTGDLPSWRLAHHRRAFAFVGVDYFGPISVTVARHHEKRYVALFTCLVSRSVHMEIAGSLSADAAIMALRRMMARRGAPDCIWSDNGTNFHGADAELRKSALDSLQQEAEIRRIRWRYIPPATPFWGGTWERMVATVKRALRATLQERHPHEDVLHTLLTEIEHTVNSRPLTHVSVSPEDEEALTPNHFLLGGPSKVPLPGTFTKVDELGRSHWRASQRLADLFWQRWIREVLPELQHRREPHGRGDPIKEGDIVLIVDSSLPRNVWPKGRVKRVYPGAGGIVRVVDIVTKNGTVLQRPTKRLIVLPVD